MLTLAHTVPPAFNVKAANRAATRGMFNAFLAVRTGDFGHDDNDGMGLMKVGRGGVYARFPYPLQPLLQVNIRFTSIFF